MRCPCSFPVYHIYPIFDNKKQGINKIYLSHNRDISTDIKTPKRKITANMILPAAKISKAKKAEQSFSAGKLTLVKFFIKTVGAEQFIMSSAFNYAPAAHNKDNIRLANG